MTQIITSPNGVHIVSYETWMTAIASSACIGFTSLVPWLFNLTFFEKDQKFAQLEGCQNGNGRMKYLLSFAIGAILGDIFFHLIPESYHSHLTELNDSRDDAYKKVGVSIIAGIFMFIIVEMIIEKWSGSPSMDDIDVCTSNTQPTSKSTSHKSGTKTQSDDMIQTIPIFSNSNNNNTSVSADLKKDFHTAIGQSNNEEIFRDILDNNNSSSALNLNECFKSTKRNGINSDDNNNNNTTLEVANGHLKCRKKDGPMSRSSIVKSKGDVLSSNDTRNTLKRKVSTTKLITVAAVAPISVDSSGYLNLIANGFDNFTHGLAIGASFLIGSKVGFLTTFVIIIHEIPHEICDYAILVNSGFTRWEAVKAQSSVSLFGIIGTATALYVKSVETLNAKTVWILPFSAGGFLYIALVNLLPEILDKKTDLRNTLGQVICVLLGIIFMAIVAIF